MSAGRLLSALPDELLLEIIDHMSLGDEYSLSVTSKRFYGLIGPINGKREGGGDLREARLWHLCELKVRTCARCLRIQPRRQVRVTKMKNKDAKYLHRRYRAFWDRVGDDDDDNSQTEYSKKVRGMKRACGTWCKNEVKCMEVARGESIMKGC